MVNSTTDCYSTTFKDSTSPFTPQPSHPSPLTPQPSHPSSLTPQPSHSSPLTPPIPHYSLLTPLTANKLLSNTYTHTSTTYIPPPLTLILIHPSPSSHPPLTLTFSLLACLTIASWPTLTMTSGSTVWLCFLTSPERSSKQDKRGEMKEENSEGSLPASGSFSASHWRSCGKGGIQLAHVHTTYIRIYMELSASNCCTHVLR